MTGQLELPDGGAPLMERTKEGEVESRLERLTGVTKKQTLVGLAVEFHSEGMSRESRLVLSWNTFVTYILIYLRLSRHASLRTPVAATNCRAHAGSSTLLDPSRILSVYLGI